MIFRRKRGAAQRDFLEGMATRLPVAAELFDKSGSLDEPADRMETYWTALKKLCGEAGETGGGILDALGRYLVQIPHEVREEMLQLSGVQRLAQLSPTLSDPQNLRASFIDKHRFKRAQSRLNRFRGHVRGSAAMTLEGLNAVFLYLVLFMNLDEKGGERHWIHDSAASIEPVFRTLMGALLRALRERGE